MLKNDKGFSLVELLAVIVITSFILMPLMTAFTNNMTIYDRLEKRRSTVGAIDVMVNSIDRLNFAEIMTALTNSGTHYIEMDSTSCTDMFLDIDDQAFCSNFVNLTYNNFEMAEGQLKIYFFDYNISEAEMTVLEQQGFHNAIYDELSTVITNDFDESTAVMRYIILGHYGDEINDVVAIGGVMANDEEN